MIKKKLTGSNRREWSCIYIYGILLKIISYGIELLS